MASNPYEHYMDNAVLTATPVELVRMLYRCAITSIEETRECLRTGDVAGRAKPVTKTLDALTELLLSLDYERGGAVARNLSDLYGYMSNRVIDGHCQQSDALFLEVKNLLNSLLESWEQVDAQCATIAPPAYTYAGDPGTPSYSYSG